MEVEELKIGNFIQIKISNNVDDWHYAQVIGISENEIDTPEYGSVIAKLYGISYILPIQLTEYWLNIFGYTYKETQKNWQKLGYTDIFYNQYTKEFLFDEIGLSNIKLEYVHQLQNAVFIIDNKWLINVND